ncbi:MAG: hypothetical protein PGN21_10130 [Sphingomonas paucimobilis]
MAEIGRADPVLLLLRERLQGRSGAAVRSSARAAAPMLSPIERTRAVAALAVLDEEGRRRLVVRAVLAERLGEAVANDAAFQTLGDRVLAELDETPEGRALVEAAMAEMAGS